LKKNPENKALANKAGFTWLAGLYLQIFGIVGISIVFIFFTLIAFSPR